MKRLDKIVTEMHPGLGRARAKELCLEGEVLVRGKAREPGFLVKDPESVQILSLPEEVKLRPELVQRAGGAESFLEIVFEDEELLVVEKPRLMHSLRQKVEDEICLADCLAAYNSELAAVSENPLEAGLVNRLDFYTAGLIVAAKTKSSWGVLHKQFTRGQTAKTYLALVEGQAEEGLIDLPIELSKGKKKVKVGVKGEGLGGEAETEIISAKPFKNFSTIEARANHLHRHQIRAHLSGIGHPLVGDELYGSQQQLPEGLRLDSEKLIREGFFLYCKELSLQHPETKKTLKFSSIKELVA